MDLKIKKIAEIGLNHMGNEKYLYDYQKILSKKNINGVTIQIPRKNFFKGKFKKYILSDKQIIKFIKSSKKKWNLVGVATSDIDKIDLFEKLDVDFFKVTSGMISNTLLLKKMIKSNVKRIYLSTGFSSYENINNILKIIVKKKISLIHTSFKKNKNINFKKILTLKKKFKLPVSYGNHSNQINSLPKSVFLKPSCIFFYVKLNKKLNYPDNDHAISLNSLDPILEKIRRNEKMMRKR